MNKKYIYLMVISGLLLSGCGVNNPTPSYSYKNKQAKKIIYINRDKPYRFNYTPIIGTQTPDDKVLVNMGVVLRVWIHSYKTKNDELVSSHDNYIWGKKPDFIVGNPVPVINRGILTPQGKMPFMLSDNSVDRSNFKDNENIKKYINSVYNKEDKKNVDKRLKKSNKFDLEIKNFINKIKKEKKQ